MRDIIKKLSLVDLKGKIGCEKSLMEKIRKAPVKNNMNPMDFQLSNNPKLKIDLNEYYSSNKIVLDEYIDISKQVDVLFKSEGFIDKGLALFIISYVKNYIK